MLLYYLKQFFTLNLIYIEIDLKTCTFRYLEEIQKTFATLYLIMLFIRVFLNKSETFKAFVINQQERLKFINLSLLCYKKYIPTISYQMFVHDTHI